MVRRARPKPAAAIASAPLIPTSDASVATVLAQANAPRALATAKRRHGIRAAPAVTAATTRTPGTQRPKKTVITPKRAKNQSARATAARRGAAPPAGGRAA